MRRALGELRSQTLPATAFEVIVVDDGSDPPLQIGYRGMALPFRCRIVRRDSDHGAHAARWAGLRAADGERVLFLDDDVAAEPGVLEAHASTALAENVALGPILYPEKEDSTPFYRYMSRFYAQCARHMGALGAACVPGDYYICNSSGPRDRFMRAFEDVVAGYAHHIVGAGFDEALLAQAIAAQGTAAVFLPDATLWHLDDKGLAQAREELYKSGAAAGRVLAEGRFPRTNQQTSALLLGILVRARVRRLAMRIFWTLPSPFRVAAGLLALVAEQGPRRQVPRWVCHVPLRLAYWDGMRSVIPTFAHLVRLVRPRDQLSRCCDDNCHR